MRQWRMNARVARRKECCAQRRHQGPHGTSHHRRRVGSAIPLPPAAAGRGARIPRCALASAQLRSTGRRPVLHSQWVRADLELPRSNGLVLVDTVDPALPVAAAGPSVAGLPGHLASRGAVGDLHAARRSRAVAGSSAAQRGQLRAPGPAGAAVVPAVLRRFELGRAGLVDQRRMAGLPAVRRAGAGDLPGGTRDESAEPDVAGGRRVAAAGGDVAG